MTNKEDKVYNRSDNQDDNGYQRQPRFYGENYAFLNIDPDIIKKLGLTESDILTQELTQEGHILLKRKVKL